MLMIPDLLGFWLTGEQIGERTNASTTGLLEIGSETWNATLIDKLSLTRSLFPSLVDPGPVSARCATTQQPKLVRLWT
jgi:rhamnulokinase